MDGLELLLRYYEEVNLCNFWGHRQKIADSMILTTGLLNAILKKGIISDDEFSEGFSLAKKQFEKEINELEKNIKLHTDKKEELEKEILKINNKQKDMKKTLQDIFRINIDDMK